MLVDIEDLEAIRAFERERCGRRRVATWASSATRYANDARLSASRSSRPRRPRRIRGKLLAALEDGDYARLPNPGYVRGYVSSYARYLELDPVPLLAMYRAETGAGRYHDINLVPTTCPWPRAVEQHAMPWRVGHDRRP